MRQVSRCFLAEKHSLTQTQVSGQNMAGKSSVLFTGSVPLSLIVEVVNFTRKKWHPI
jgi:hypothetical protein